MKNSLLYMSILVSAAFNIDSAFAAPLVYTPIASTAAGANLVSTTLTAQSDLLQKDYSNKESAAATAAASSNSVDSTASLITQEVEGNIASTISESITNTNGNAPTTGSFSLGNGETISYNRAGGNTSVTIDQVGQQAINLSFPTIQ